MEKKVIIISEYITNFKNSQTVSLSNFLSTKSYKDVYVLIDRYGITTKNINKVREHCKKIGLNTYIDGSQMDITRIFFPDDWQSDESYEHEITKSVRYLEESEVEHKLYILSSKKNVHPVVSKLLRLAKDSAASFGEKRNAVNSAYRLVYGY